MNEKSMSGLSFIFDIDGTICPIKERDERYEELVPFKDVIQKIKFYHEQGARIVLFTSRNMKTYNGNLGLINANTAKTLLKWLEAWEIPYDEIIYGKPWPGDNGFYVDDRAVRPNEFLSCNVEELSLLCENSRCRK